MSTHVIGIFVENTSSKRFSIIQVQSSVQHCTGIRGKLGQYENTKRVFEKTCTAGADIPFSSHVQILRLQRPSLSCLLHGTNPPDNGAAYNRKLCTGHHEGSTYVFYCVVRLLCSSVLYSTMFRGHHQLSLGPILTGFSFIHFHLFSSLFLSIFIQV